MFLYRNFILKTETQIKSNPKLFWSFIRAKKRESGLPSTLRNEAGDTFTTPSMIVEAFQSVFSSVYTNSPATSTKTLPTSSLQYVNSAFVHIPSFSEADVVQAIAKLKDSITMGDDN
ncbi:hypothetical protein QE152_g11012 [Popillia japonica]|uniref:Uncharacterized protein n=1 Tax=Popillia japonica TaxID=7064 RepID=A0AAW1LTF0_POPJA